MMTYDPYQTYSALAPYYGLNSPIGSPYAAVTGGIPQVTGQTSYPGFNAPGGINPQQLQLASLLASQAAIPQLLGISPWATGLANPLVVAALHNNNPLLAAVLQNPQLNPILGASGHSMGPQFGYQPNSMYGQTGSPYGQQSGSPFGQTGSPYGQQTGSPFGQTGSPYGQQFGSPYGQTGSLYGQQSGSPFGQLGSPYGQQQYGSPYGQGGSPYGQIGSALAPQSWIGQGGPFGGQQFGQGNPLQSQFGARPFQTSGISPWGWY
ncbi:MAG TPA: hypothetical protein VG168_16480 [Bryobacteraceae bacterium]|nr:hypothetical protein [Bryobacteraceae bacterium]